MDALHVAEPTLRPFRLAVVTETWPPDINGVAMTLQRLVSGLRERGHRVEVVRTRLPAASHSPEAGLWTMPSLPIPGYPSLRFGLPAVRRLRACFELIEPDVLYVATEGPLGASALKVARERGIPVVSGFHTHFQQYVRHYRLGLLQPLVTGWLRRFHRRTALTLVPDETLCRDLAERGFGRTAVLPRGVDCERFQPQRRDPALRSRWGAGPDDPVALYVGRIASEKNLDLFVEAVQRMRTVEAGVRGVVVGDGPRLTALRRRHPDLHFCGARTGLDLAVHYASADVFPFPSQTETFGNVVLEAMASGLIVLAYDYAAAHRFITDGRDGFVAPFGERAAFLSAAEALAARGLADLRAVRERARQRVLPLDWGHIVVRFERLLHGVMATPVSAVS